MPTVPLPAALNKFSAYFSSCEMRRPTVCKPAPGVPHLCIDTQTEIARELYKELQNLFVSITAPFKAGWNVEGAIAVNIIIMVNWVRDRLYRNGPTEFIKENHMAYLVWNIQRAYFLLKKDSKKKKDQPQKSVSGKTISLPNPFSSFSHVLLISVPFLLYSF